MANKEIVIDVVSEYSDHASSGLQQTGKNAEKASREMDKLGKKRAKPKLGLEDKASPVLDKFGKKGDGLGKKTKTWIKRHCNSRDQKSYECWYEFW